MTKILNLSKGGRAILLAAVAVWCAGHVPGAKGIPPAPYHLIYGLAKDSYGTPLSSANCFVILQSQGVHLTGQVIPGLGAGVNYQIKVPMDAGQTSQLYRPDALTVSAPFTMLVVISTVTNLPIEMTGAGLLLGQSGGATKINLTIGKDSNGDGIPDAWEYAYLSTLGLNVPLSSINANSMLAGNGQTLLQAYLLGLPVFDPGSAFQVTMAGFVGNSPVLQFPGMTGRSYTVLGSSDLNTWTPLTFNLPTDAPGAPGHPFFYSSAIQNVQLQVNLPAPAAAGMYLKVLLQ
ncbi:MAG TPA: hypothetical protein VFC44_24310 [Candidatus Saccharimonadales bacterium]|nr:hypothetical protein [Candidatus Saccharimonadales bacterium]